MHLSMVLELAKEMTLSKKKGSRSLDQELMTSKVSLEMKARNNQFMPNLIRASMRRKVETSQDQAPMKLLKRQTRSIRHLLNSVLELLSVQRVFQRKDQLRLILLDISRLIPTQKLKVQHSDSAHLIESKQTASSLQHCQVQALTI